MKRASYTFVFLAALFVANPGFADWYDDYQRGIQAAKASNWQTVIDRMTAAIRAKDREDPRARPYGNVFVNYRPYYYRGMAYYELGRWQQAIDDLERTGGPGEFSLGSPDSKIVRAMNELKGAATPTPTRVPIPPTQEPTRATPTPTPTQRPTIPPLITPTPTAVPPPGETTSARDARVRAMRSLQSAQNERVAAVQQNAPSLARRRFSEGETKLSRAQALMTSAQTVADWNVVGSTAEGARASFAQARTEASSPVDEVLAQTRTRVRTALEAYFDGRYDDAQQQFQNLATQQNSNALLWAFYGASVYSSYYIDGQRNAQARAEAERAFRRARSLNLRELPASYFSPRIRRFYNSLR